MANAAISEPRGSNALASSDAQASTAPSNSAGVVMVRPRGENEAAVRSLIADARKPARPACRGVWLLASLSAVLWYCSFYPLNWGPLAFIAPVPLLLLARLEQRPRWMYGILYLTQLAAHLAAISWMAANGPMVGAWLALSFYLALYGPAFVLAVRTATQRLHMPLVMAAPIAWAGLELLQAHLMTGFAWYFLGHSQWRWTTLIQICDIVGVYGVSFVVTACAAAMAVCMPVNLFSRLRLLPTRDGSQLPITKPAYRVRGASVAFALTLLTATLAYGSVRTSGDYFTAGPRVALVQGNFPSRLSGDNATAAEVFHMHHRLTGMAAAYQPQFVIWPESSYRWPILEAKPGMTEGQLRTVAPEIPVEEWSRPDVREILGDIATQANAGVMIGLTAYAADPEQGFKKYNSALFVKPEVGIAGRYDKRHRVVFGEYIPLQKELPFMAAAAPFTAGFSIDAGDRPETFELGGYRVTPLICYEDTVPHLVNSVVAAANELPAEKRIDLLVNQSNDGWFYESSEQEQHVVTSLFRAVETRTPLVRAANTGVSAVIDGDGRLVEPVAFLNGETREPMPFIDPTGRFAKNVPAALVADVPLDTRSSLYVKYGDWFGGICAALTLFCLGWTFMPQRRTAAA